MSDELKERIRQAELIFVTKASRLLDEAEDVRRQRDELLELIRQSNAGQQGAATQ